MCWMLPGGRVCGVRVLLTAMVILHGAVGSLRIKLPISASKGRWPPSCSVTFTPFTHCKRWRQWFPISLITLLNLVRTKGWVSNFKTAIVADDFYFSALAGEVWKGAHDTHHDGKIVSTCHSENHSYSFISDPAGRHHHLSLIPHPAYEISQLRVLCDVIVAGRNWHVNHWASLRRIQPQWKNIISFLTVDLLHSVVTL